MERETPAQEVFSDGLPSPGGNPGGTATGAPPPGPTNRSSSEYQKGFCEAVFSVGDPRDRDVREDDILMLEETESSEL